MTDLSLFVVVVIVSLVMDRPFVDPGLVVATSDDVIDSLLAQVFVVLAEGRVLVDVVEI